MPEAQQKEIRDFQSVACAPSFEMMGKGHLVVNPNGKSWELPTLAELLSPDYKPRNVNADGSWVPASA